jgi:hypothetical protein
MGQKKMFKVTRELAGKNLYAYFVVWAGSMEIARFPSPEFEYTNKGQLITKANPLYGKELPKFHLCMSKEGENKLFEFMGAYCRAVKNKKPLPTFFHFSVYDIFYERDNG